MINPLQSINKNFIVGILGSAAGGPVAALMGTMQGGQLKQLGQLLKGLQSLFGKSQGMAGGGIPQRPLPFSSANININISVNPLGALQQPGGSGPLQSFGKAPIVGNDSQWKGLADTVNSRITGSDAAKKGVAFDGTNPWTKGGDKTEMAAIGWAMQKNDKVRYDADRKQFYVTNADGSTRDVASLAEMKDQINKAGGANPSNGAAFNAVGAFLDGRVGKAQTPGGGGAQKASPFANPFQQLFQMLEKLVQALTGQGGAGRAGSAGGGAGSAGSAAAGAAGSSVGGGSGVSSMDSMIGKAGSSIDSMMGQAEKLMASDKPSDQLKGQMMMQRAMRLFEMISKMIEQRSQAQAKAIQAIK